MDFTVIDKPVDARGRMKYVPIIAAIFELPPDKAISIPQNGAKLTTVRTAIMKGAERAGFRVSTREDQINKTLIVWKES